MNNKEQQIAIAESQGWKGPDHPDVKKHVATWTKPEIWYMKPNGLLTWLSDVPVYDLNGMHKIEETLTGEQCREYESWIRYVTGNTEAWAYRSITANAAHRREAFLRTLGLWKK